jgi:hypothetical protein
MWLLWCLYQGTEWTGSVTYTTSFNITDTSAEFAQLSQAHSTATNPAVLAVIDRQLVALLGEDPEAVLAAAEAAAPVTRTYENGEPIAEDLPAGYRNATGESQQCENCAFYNSETFQCSRWNNAPVRPMWVCAVWEPQDASSAS